jgi:hypothetical protein
MSAPNEALQTISNAWEVFVLFFIPVGGGVPAGVILAKKRGFGWITMTFVYFISDLVLACLFEPLVLLMKAAGRRFTFVARINEGLKKSTHKTIAKYGLRPNVLSLITISFGVDPMTGRTAALAAGHGFISGWTLAIIGDMLFFLILMISTLCLNNILGDGTWAAVIIMVAMTVVPVLVRKVRERLKAIKGESIGKYP